MDNDDLPVGRILGRREVLGLFGGLGLVALVGCDDDEPASTGSPTPSPTATSTGTAASTATSAVATGTVVPACVVVPERTEGPYFVDGQIERSDIVEDRPGAPLTLAVNVMQVGADGCTPLPDAIVDVWHCDATGVYSDVGDAAGEQFLRGFQRTDSAGLATFTTIYPGWYQGRTVHIHFKIRTQGDDGGTYEFTSQWFFDDALTDQVFATQLYGARGPRDTRNADDGIFADDGEVLTLNAQGDMSSGYRATFDVGLDLSDASVGASDSAAGGTGGPGGAPPSR